MSKLVSKDLNIKLILQFERGQVCFYLDSFLFTENHVCMVYMVLNPTMNSRQHSAPHGQHQSQRAAQKEAV